LPDGSQYEERVTDGRCATFKAEREPFAEANLGRHAPYRQQEPAYMGRKPPWGRQLNQQVNAHADHPTPNLRKIYGIDGWNSPGLTEEDR